MQAFARRAGRRSTVAAGVAVLAAVLVVQGSLRAQVAGPPGSPGPGLAPPPQLAPTGYHLQIVAPLPGKPSMFARGMNGRGVVVGHAGDDPADPTAQPFVLIGDELQPLPSLGGSLDFALGLGGADLVAGTSGGAPVAWEKGTPRVLAAPGLFSGAAHDANGAGRLCGSMFNDFTGQLFGVVWERADLAGVLLPVPDGSFGAQAFALNEAGQVGGAVIGGAFPFVGARWDDLSGSPVLVGPLPGDENSEVIALNEHGDAAGRSGSATAVQAMLYRADTGTAQGLGWLAGSFSEARAIDGRRRVLGASSAPGGEAHGFLWSDGVLHDLNDLVGAASEPFLYVSNGIAFDRKGRLLVEVVVPANPGTATRIGLMSPPAPLPTAR